MKRAGSLIIFILIVMCVPAGAQVQCVFIYPPMKVNMDLSQALTTSNNIKGKVSEYRTTTPAQDTGVQCWGPPGKEVLGNTRISHSFIVSGTEGPWTYYRVDDYFSIAFGSQGCGHMEYVPTQPMSVLCNGKLILNKGGNALAFLKSPVITWTARLRIERAFSGPRTINLPDIFKSYYGDMVHDLSMLQSVSLVGTITVPETCTINAGQTIQVNFGDIGAGRFEAVGQMPAGYTPVITSAPVTCNDATPAPGLNSAIRTTNPDIGIVVQDVNDRTVRPNLDTLPLRLQSNGAGRNDGTVVMKAFPVSTTGRPPAEGNFSGTAAITVTFD